MAATGGVKSQEAFESHHKFHGGGFRPLVGQLPWHAEWTAELGPLQHPQPRYATDDTQHSQLESIVESIHGEKYYAVVVFR